MIFVIDQDAAVSVSTADIEISGIIPNQGLRIEGFVEPLFCASAVFLVWEAPAMRMIMDFFLFFSEFMLAEV